MLKWFYKNKDYSSDKTQNKINCTLLFIKLTEFYDLTMKK